MDKQGNKYTFLYASVMVILVAALLAFVSESLKERQNKNVEVAKKIDLLKSVNIASDATNAADLYSKYIGDDAFIVNAQGEKVEGDAFKVDLSKELKKDPAQRSNPLYVCKLPDGTNKYIIPVRGKGLWGPIWGYLSLDEDKNTVYGATFGHKSETPGLGAEIETVLFQQPFTGKQIFDADGRFTSITVTKAGQSAGNVHAVDGISGGTITSKGVQAMLKDCLSGYEKYLKN